METTENTNSTTKSKKEKPSGTPPAKPSQNSNTSSDSTNNTAPESNNADSGNSGGSSDAAQPAVPQQADGEMPEMPVCEEGDEGCEIPEMPGGMQGGLGDRPEEMMMQDSNSNTWHPAAYLGIGAGSVILSTAIIYACFSNLFHKRPGQVFDKWQKFAIFCGAIAVLSATICVLGYFIPEWIS